MAALPLVVVVDVDPDWRIPHGSETPYKGEIEWTGLREGVPRLLELMSGVTDSEQRPVRFTWLLRSDHQMATILGDPAYLATEFADFWEERLARGDEIGWHPHAWRFSEKNSVWYQETQDLDWIAECYKEGHRAMVQHFPILSAKPGWMYHDNHTIRMFSDLGIKIDLAAVPGMSYSGTIPSTRLPLWTYDWLRAPQEPYHPAQTDYQVPGNGKSLPILEVPNWTFPIGRLRGAQHRIRKRSQRDFANPAKLPFLVSSGFKRPPFTVPFVCYFHPEELLGRTKLFDVANVKENLSTLFQACNARGIVLKSVTAGELLINQGLS